MTSRLTNIINTTILVSYFALVVVTPLLFSTQNSELFEVPKMLFVYFLAVIILFSTKIKFVLQKKKSIPLNLIFISLVLFVIVQIASTFSSIDKFTSVFGFPSRLNGGLLSQFAYAVIFAGALINISKENAKKLLTASIIASLAVALWGIPGHFGKDPNCLILTGNLNSTCWQKDFDPKVRIFSTLGQPNWLASYLVLILPVTLALTFTFKKLQTKLIFFGVTQIIFLAFIFTNSRAGAVGLASAILIFLLLLGLDTLKQNLKVLVPCLLSMLLISFFFGITLTSRIKEGLTQTRVPQEKEQKNSPQQKTTQSSLTTGGTESGQIRLIVWEGAIKIIKKNPLVGTGPETFAYSYYQNRPLAHNKTTEWNFFYNKAHNEILNNFANLGVLGGISFIGFLLVTLITLAKSFNQSDERTKILTKGIISSVIGYQITILFGFSTVATQLLMFLLIAIALILTNEIKLKEINLKFLNKPLQIAACAVIAIAGLYCLSFVARLYLSDIFITRAKELDVTNPQSLLVYSNAIATAPQNNPFYLADTAYSIALYATSVEDKEISSSFESQADSLAQKSYDISGANILTARKIANTYLLLSSINEKYKSKAQDAGNLIVKLAPTDPQSYVSLAKIQIAIGKEPEAKKNLQTALSLKPEYQDAKDLLEQIEVKEIQ